MDAPPRSSAVLHWRVWKPADMDMRPKDVPSPIDFHNEAEVRAWIEQTIQKRPYRAAFFKEFANEICTVEHRDLKVLELGSGPGMLAEQILHRCPTVSVYTLLDFSRPMLAMSRERLAEFATRSRFVRADFRADDWMAQVGTVDAVLSMQAAHEVRQKCHVPALYEKIRVVLRPGGLMLICDHLPGENPDARRSALYMTPYEQLAAFDVAGLRRAAVHFAANGMALYKAYAPEPKAASPGAAR
jgi:SAM-dependent methyltransferase